MIYEPTSSIQKYFINPKGTLNVVGTLQRFDVDGSRKDICRYEEASECLMMRMLRVAHNNLHFAH